MESWSVGVESWSVGVESWSVGVESSGESWSRVMEWSVGVEPWMEILEWNRKLSSSEFVLVRMKPSRNV